MQILTTKGLLELDQLEVTDIVRYEDNARVVATEWHHGGELVRRDVWISVLRPLESEATTAPPPAAAA